MPEVTIERARKCALLARKILLVKGAIEIYKLQSEVEELTKFFLNISEDIVDLNLAKNP
jgi:hypothetical protein